MNDWFAFGGKNCTDFGIWVTELPPVTIPKERVTFDTVTGRSGTLARTEGKDIYDDSTLTIKCCLRDDADIAGAVNWLKGEGWLYLPNRPGMCAKARVCNMIELSRVIPGVRFHEFAVQMRVQPGWYHTDAEQINLRSPGTVFNPGTFYAQPKVRIKGSGSFWVSFGIQRMDFTDIEEGVVLDCEMVEAFTYDEALLYNANVDGQFWRLDPGYTVITWGIDDGSTLEKMEIIPRWRSL